MCVCGKVCVCVCARAVCVGVCVGVPPTAVLHTVFSVANVP